MQGMESPLHVVNADLAHALGSASPALQAGLLSAVGGRPGQVLDPAMHPILGFYLEAAADQFTGYLLTPGRLVRYEANSAESLTVTVPLDRVGRVVELTNGTALRVSVEMSADAVTTVTMPDGLQRSLPATYEIDALGGPDTEKLAEFSRVLRMSLGI